MLKSILSVIFILRLCTALKINCTYHLLVFEMGSKQKRYGLY
ncbi:hypothetical protein LEP1GSC086_1124 [Leptospira weilii str. LNT 1234]|nr:hypothetical protein LEP1GSC086_1124 [Leptospira weilii str. LNT 1234]